MTNPLAMFRMPLNFRLLRPYSGLSASGDAAGRSRINAINIKSGKES